MSLNYKTIFDNEDKCLSFQSLICVVEKTKIKVNDIERDQKPLFKLSNYSMGPS